MQCPACQLDDDKVIDSRPTPAGTIRRRRECLACGKRWTTTEIDADLLGAVNPTAALLDAVSDNLAEAVKLVQRSRAELKAEAVNQRHNAADAA